MDFTEEKTPGGITLKIMFKHWKFLAFDGRGNSIYADEEGRTLLHKIPTMVFLGKNMTLDKKYTRDYELFKIRDNELIIPYLYNHERTYLFLPERSRIDLIPVLTDEYKSYSIMLKTLQSGKTIDYLIIDNTVTDIELSVISSKYKPNEIINISTKNRQKEKQDDAKEGSYGNVNIMSENPVFLAQMHLRNMALSNLNQILLDFDISPFDTQYIIFFINDMIKKIDESSEGKQKKAMLMDLRNSFQFYLALLTQDNDSIDEMILAQTDYKKMAPFRTLLSKVRSNASTSDAQITYNEYENRILDHREKLLSEKNSNPL